MDLSKLPRLSKNPMPPQNTPAEPLPAPGPREGIPSEPSRREPAPEDRDATGLAIGAEVWFMTILGLVLIFFGGNIIRYKWSQLKHQPYHTQITWQSGDKEGQEVEYPDLIDMSGMRGGSYYTDSCLVLFGLTLIIDGVGRALAGTRLPGRPFILGITLAFTLLTFGYNLVVAAKYFGAGSLPIVSALAIAFTGYLAMMQFVLMQSIRVAPAGGRAI